MKINVGFLLSYDYDLLRHAIPTVYHDADSILLSYDIAYKTWAGNDFQISKDFFDWIRIFDTQKKIFYLKENFYNPNLSTMQNETQQRRAMAEALGEGFHIQLDADEYMVDFKNLVKTIKSKKELQLDRKPKQIRAYLINIYKKVANGYLLIDEYNSFYLGSNKPDYIRARKNHDQQKIYLPYFALHQSWARTEEEIYFKLQNWGHNEDFDVDRYFEFWNSIDENNYQEFHNFHPLNDKDWKKLVFVPAQNMEDLILEMQEKELPQSVKSQIFFKNLGQQFKYLFR